MPKGGIPDRWEDYTVPVGDQIPGTRFITFKVPLHPRLCNHLKKEERFTPSDLLRLLDDRERSVGQIIDLTQTNRYYDPTEFQDNNIEHIKIATRGHVVPDRRTCKRFAKTVDKFLEENKENDLLIGVHCTHGVNRTGYLVCRYMIDKLDFQPENAIEAFNTARGYDIERENYLGALKNGASDDNHRDEDHPRDQWRPQDRHNPRDHDLAPHRHGYQDYQGHQRPHHGGYNGTFNGGYNPRHQGGYNPGHRGGYYPGNRERYNPEHGGYNPRHQEGYGYGRPRNPYQNWTNDFPERQFGHQHHHGAYSAASTRGAHPPPHDPYWYSPNNQWNGAFDNESRYSSSSYSRHPVNNHHPHGERSYGRNWSGPSSRGHHGSNSPNGRSNRRFNPYATYSSQ